jgi:hypothetical protein
MCPRKLNAIVLPSGEIAGYRSQSGFVSGPSGTAGLSANIGDIGQREPRNVVTIERPTRPLITVKTRDVKLNIVNRTH